MNTLRCRCEWLVRVVVPTMVAILACANSEIHRAAAEEPETTNPKHTNRLAKETSPYLLLHAHNPVDWYPWGTEALAKAKEENKLIFLSIGYSSCYWCHVMERESFMDDEIAKFLNEHFVCIKVDREERPDVDDIYMTSLSVYHQLVGSRQGGGWPLSMFLTPDAKPFVGGTYFPRATATAKACPVFSPWRRACESFGATTKNKPKATPRSSPTRRAKRSPRARRLFR